MNTSSSRVSETRLCSGHAAAVVCAPKVYQPDECHRFPWQHCRQSSGVKIVRAWPLPESRYSREPAASDHGVPDETLDLNNDVIGVIIECRKDLAFLYAEQSAVWLTVRGRCGWGVPGLWAVFSGLCLVVPAAA